MAKVPDKLGSPSGYWSVRTIGGFHRPLRWIRRALETGAAWRREMYKTAMGRSDQILYKFEVSVWSRSVQCFVSSSSELHVCSLLHLVDLVSFHQHLGLCPAGLDHVDIIHGRCSCSDHFGWNQEDDTCLRLLVPVEHRLVLS